MSPLSQVHTPPLCPAAHPLLLGGEGGAWEEESRRPLSVPSSQDLSHLPSSWALPFGAPAWGWHPRLEKRTQGSLFQPRRQRAPLSTPGPSPHWVSVCEGVEPVRRGRRRGRTAEDRSSCTAPGATFAASSACPEPAPRLTAQKDADAVDKVMKELDENGDGEVDFQEYVVLVAALTVACNNFFWENS
ncbi:protein S100-A1 isoform X1 [Bos taurus]|uniref:protein S100-A1 isoform X1 n=1 Tax=Bos taurus TaxID=9913 RepID=UPI000383FC8D|nr:protein S100-A1 isoform X1 [Bos taurus]